jgi:hypothetical protein
MGTIAPPPLVLDLFCSNRSQFSAFQFTPAIFAEDNRLGHANPAVTLLVYSHFLKHAESAVADRLADELMGCPSATRTQKDMVVPRPDERSAGALIGRSSRVGHQPSQERFSKIRA